MNKILALAILAMTFVSSIASAYYGQNDNNCSHKDNSTMARYLRHEISTDECVDSYVPRSHHHEARVYHSDGSQSLIRYSDIN